MTESTLIAHCGARKITLEELRGVPTPDPTRTHQPVAHATIVDSITESLTLRHIEVRRMEFAVSPDGMRCFGVLDLIAGFSDFAFAIGFRNANDKSLRLALTAGVRVFICDNLAFRGDFQPVLAKHSKSLSLENAIEVGIKDIQKALDPFAKQIQGYKDWQLSEEQAKVFIYDTFFVAKIFPKHLLDTVHHHFFHPVYEDFKPQTVWSLHNAFTSTVKEGLSEKPVQQFQITAKFGDYFRGYWG